MRQQALSAQFHLGRWCRRSRRALLRAACYHRRWVLRSLSLSLTQCALAAGGRRERERNAIHRQLAAILHPSPICRRRRRAFLLRRRAGWIGKICMSNGRRPLARSLLVLIENLCDRAEWRESGSTAAQRRATPFTLTPPRPSCASQQLPKHTLLSLSFALLAHISVWERERFFSWFSPPSALNCANLRHSLLINWPYLIWTPVFNYYFSYSHFAQSESPKEDNYGFWPIPKRMVKVEILFN